MVQHHHCVTQTVILEVNSEQVDTEYLSSSNIFCESHPAAPHSYRS